MVSVQDDSVESGRELLLNFESMINNEQYILYNRASVT